MSKMNKLLAVYMAILIAFTGYVCLDTFFITEVYGDAESSAYSDAEADESGTDESDTNESAEEESSVLQNDQAVSAGTVTDSRLVQSENAFSPIVVTLAGRVARSRASQRDAGDAP